MQIKYHKSTDANRILNGWLYMLFFNVVYTTIVFHEKITEKKTKNLRGNTVYYLAVDSVELSRTYYYNNVIRRVCCYNVNNIQIITNVTYGTRYATFCTQSLVNTGILGGPKCSDFPGRMQLFVFI